MLEASLGDGATAYGQGLCSYRCYQMTHISVSPEDISLYFLMTVECVVFNINVLMCIIYFGKKVNSKHTLVH